MGPTQEPAIRRSHIVTLAFAAVLVLPGCAPGDRDDQLGDDLDDPVDGVDDDPPEGGEDPAATNDDERTRPDTGENGDDGEDGTAPLAGDPSTEASTDDGEAGLLAVTDVRVATHAGFDRIVFEIEGDGAAGWDVRYVEEARSQGRGDAIEVDGDAVLSIAVRNVALPPDLPDDIEVWDTGRLAGPEGGVVTEVVGDTIFEGQYVFFAGLDLERPFLVERFEGPQRIVIDIFHDG